MALIAQEALGQKRPGFQVYKLVSYCRKGSPAGLPLFYSSSFLRNFPRARFSILEI